MAENSKGKNKATFPSLSSVLPGKKDRSEEFILTVLSDWNKQSSEYGGGSGDTLYQEILRMSGRTWGSKEGKLGLKEICSVLPADVSAELKSRFAAWGRTTDATIMAGIGAGLGGSPADYPVLVELTHDTAAAVRELLDTRVSKTSQESQTQPSARDIALLTEVFVPLSKKYKKVSTEGSQQNIREGVLPNLLHGTADSGAVQNLFKKQIRQTFVKSIVGGSKDKILNELLSIHSGDEQKRLKREYNDVSVWYNTIMGYPTALEQNLQLTRIATEVANHLRPALEKAFGQEAMEEDRRMMTQSFILNSCVTTAEQQAENYSQLRTNLKKFIEQTLAYNSNVKTSGKSKVAANDRVSYYDLSLACYPRTEDLVVLGHDYQTTKVRTTDKLLHVLGKKDRQVELSHYLEQMTDIVETTLKEHNRWANARRKEKAYGAGSKATSS